MTPERWAQIEGLFHRAAECEAGERTVLLDQACSNDPELRREVESLLSSDRSAGDSVRAAVRAELDTVGFPLAGETVSHYRILDGLGGGGMGLVYRAEDMKLGRRVALKFLPEESANDPVSLARFEREARSASALEHPNICPIYEFGDHQGRTFLVMPLLEGRTLREWIAAATPSKPPFGIEKLLDLAIQILDGLGAAHQKGIIHRDIKPANIFVTSQGQAKILDFGLAKLTSALTSASDELEQDPGDRRAVTETSRGNVTPSNHDLSLSRTGVAIGTAGYMSPEQICGGRLDARTDLFSFGLVFYEMATGKRAFTGDSGPVLQQATLTEIPAIARKLNPQLPVKLGRIIAKAIEKNREARYQAVSEMQDDLASVRHEIDRRNPIQWWIAASVCIFTVAIIAAFWWFAKHQAASIQFPLDIRFRQLTINSGENPVSSGSISPNGKYLGYVDKQGMHVKDIETGMIQAVIQPQGAKKDWEVLDAAWFPDNVRFIANAHPEGEDAAKWSSRTTSVWVFSRTDEAPRKLRENAIAWSVSPNGALVSFSTNAGRLGEHELWLIGQDGQQARKAFETDENSYLAGFFWSPDSQRGLFLRTDSLGDTLLMRNLQGGSPVTVLSPAETKQTRGDFSWLPDGRLIYQVADPGAEPEGVRSLQDTCNFWTMRLDPHTGTPIGKPKRLTNWTGFCNSITANFTADGKRLVFLRTANSWSVNVAELEAGRTRLRNMRHFTLDESTDFLQDWTNDSKNIIFTSSRTGRYAIYRQALGTDQPTLMSTGAGGFRDTPATPDGKWVFGLPYPNRPDLTEDRLMRIPLAGGSPELVAATLPAGIFCARPPARLCVLAERTGDRKHLIFTSVDVLKGRGPELARFDLDPGVEYWDFDISPDGTRLAVSGNPLGPIHILSLGGHAELVIPTKFESAAEFHWAADGSGLYVPDQTERGTVLYYMDLHGTMHVLWVNPSGWPVWARPSPDGRHLAIENTSASGNIWMMENF